MHSHRSWLVSQMSLLSTHSQSQAKGMAGSSVLPSLLTALLSCCDPEVRSTCEVLACSCRQPSLLPANCHAPCCHLTWLMHAQPLAACISRVAASSCTPACFMRAEAVPAYRLQRPPARSCSSCVLNAWACWEL